MAAARFLSFSLLTSVVLASAIDTCSLYPPITTVTVTVSCDKPEAASSTPPTVQLPESHVPSSILSAIVPTIETLAPSVPTLSFVPVPDPTGASEGPSTDEPESEGSSSEAPFPDSSPSPSANDPESPSVDDQESPSETPVPAPAETSSTTTPSSSLSVPEALPTLTGKTTRYWDCCKPSCAWSGKASVTAPVGTCGVNDAPLSDANAQSGCNGGGAYTCGDQSPWAVNDDLSYGFAAVKLNGKGEGDWCCSCYELTFTSGPVAGKKLVVQATNTGGDLGDNHFDLAMPGGGVGIFTQGCAAQWAGASFGAQYGGYSSRSECDQLPAAWRKGCYWRYDWFQNADNPTVAWREVTCPAELTARTGCARL